MLLPVELQKGNCTFCLGAKDDLFNIRKFFVDQDVVPFGNI